MLTHQVDVRTLRYEVLDVAQIILAVPSNGLDAE